MTRELDLFLQHKNSVNLGTWSVPMPPNVRWVTLRILKTTELIDFEILPV